MKHFESGNRTPVSVDEKGGEVKLTSAESSLELAYTIHLGAKP